MNFKPTLINSMTHFFMKNVHFYYIFHVYKIESESLCVYFYKILA